MALFYLAMCWAWTLGAVFWLYAWSKDDGGHWRLFVMALYEAVALLYGWAAISAMS